MLKLDSARPKPSTAVYYPNNIGLAAPASSTIFALLVEGKDDKGVVPMLVMNTLIERGARILSQTGCINDGEFRFSLICDLREVRGAPDDAIIALRKMKHVTHAEAQSLKNRMFDGSLFPLTLMDTNRVLALSSSLMFEIQARLSTEAEKIGLFEAGRDYGKDVASRIKQKFENSSRTISLDLKTIQENAKDYLRAAGWGKFNWEADESAEHVLIQDPPTSKGGSAEGNLFLQGMVAGLTETFQDKKLGVIEDRYDPQTRLLTLTLVQQSKMRFVDPSTDELSSYDEKARELGEIEKIIKSVETKFEENKPQQKAVVRETPVRDTGKIEIIMVENENQKEAEPYQRAEKVVEKPEEAMNMSVKQKASEIEASPTSAKQEIQPANVPPIGKSANIGDLAIDNQQPQNNQEVESTENAAEKPEEALNVSVKKDASEIEALTPGLKQEAPEIEASDRSGDSPDTLSWVQEDEPLGENVNERIYRNSDAEMLNEGEAASEKDETDFSIMFSERKRSFRSPTGEPSDVSEDDSTDEFSDDTDSNQKDSWV